MSNKDPLFNFDMSDFFRMAGGRGDGQGGDGDGGDDSGPRRPVPPRPQLPRVSTPLKVTIAILVSVALIIFFGAEIWTEILWFSQLGFASVLWTRWGAMAGVGLVAFLITFGSLWATLRVVNRAKPPLDSLRGSSRELARANRAMVRSAGLVVPLIFGAFAAFTNLGMWQSLLVAVNSTSFGEADPVLGMDVSFYAFILPFLAEVVSFFLTLMIFCVMTALIGHYLVGAITIAPEVTMTKTARIQVAVMLAVGSLLVGANYFLGRYLLLSAHGAPTHGAMYTDVNAQLPAQTILAVIALLIAVLFLVAAARGTWRLPVAGIAMMVVSALVVGAAYPMLVQRFKVQPNARELESPYIQHNIDATLKAYGLDDLEYQTYNAKTEATAGQLREDAESTSQIRLLDPLIIPPTVRQMQQSRPYYTFTDQFSVDRYTIEGQRRDTVIAVRELSLKDLSAEQRTWVNDHTVYTHGFGVVAAYGNTATVDGMPTYWEQSIPSVGQMGEYEPRVYFSPLSPEYSIVGAPAGAPPQELDYPDDTASGGQVNSTYAGNGGPAIGNVFNRLMYALKFKSWDMFFSDQVNDKSQILYDRDPALRVAKAAPYLTLERKPYPAVVDMDGDPATPKRLVWIIDGYTTLNSYPYAQHESLDETTQDSRTSGGERFSQRSEINYIRNSVKAVVDAYDGSVSLYRWDQEDPVLATWMKVFPGKVKPLAEMSGDLMAHMRYPQDLFKVQRSLLTSYHVTNAPEFYTGGDRWKLSEDPTVGRGPDSATELQPPYYLTMKMPGQESAEFSLTSVFIPGGGSKRAAMAGFLAVDSETGSQPGKIREGYGKLRLIALPSSTTVPGPGQVQQSFNTNSVVAKELNLQDQQGSKVLRGNLLTLPVGGGLLYVQPVYIQSTGTTSYPQLRHVLVGFGGKIGFASTLQEALDQVFGGDSGGQTAQTPAGDGQGAATSENPNANPGSNPQLRQALEAAKKAIAEADAAMKAGDWARYGQAQAALDKAITDALIAQGMVATQPDPAAAAPSETPAADPAASQAP